MNNTLLEAPVNKALLAMAAPAAVGMLMTFLFQLVDTYFVGKLGTPELAAMSFAYPVYFFVVSFFMGAAAGVSAVVGKALGERSLFKVQLVTSATILLLMLFTCGLGFMGFYTVPPLFSLLGASKQQIVLIAEYMQPLYIGMCLLVGTLVANAALMAKGVMLKTTIVMGISGTVNLLLDYILIFGMGPIPALGLQGAAIATVIAWAVGWVLMLSLAFRQKLVSVVCLASLNQLRDYLGEVKQVAIPSIAAQILNPIAIAVVTAVIAKHGESAVAAYGIVTRIESLGLTGVLALSVILTPMVAQNFGAKQYQRLDQVIAYSGRMTVYWGLFFYLLMVLFSRPIAGIFTTAPEVIANSQMYFYIVGLSLPCFGLLLTTTSFFNGVQESQSSLKLTLVKSFGLTIPLVLIATWFNVVAIWLALALANILAALYAGRVLNKWLKDQRSDLVGKVVWQDYLSDFRGLARFVKRQ